MKNLIKITPIIIISILMSACNNSQQGEVVSSELSFDAFERIEVRSSANLEISYSSEQKDILVTGDEEAIKNIEARIINNKLIIDEKDNFYINSKSMELTYYISLPKIISLEITGSSQVSIFDFPQVEDFNIDISGSGDIEINSFKNIKNFDVNISGSGDINGNSIFGNLENLNVEISGSGDYRGFEIETQEANVEISGSGNVKLTANRQLDIYISGSGNVSYKGNPVVISKITGSGDIIEAN